MLFYCFVEGYRDKEFIKRVIEPKFRHIKWEYIEMQQKRKEKLHNFFNSVLSMHKKGIANFIILIDSDINNNPNRTYQQIKSDFIRKKSINITINKIFIAIIEIESWYLAGLSADICNHLGIKYFSDTSVVSKEQVKCKEDKNLCLNKILDNFDINTATKQNKSFKIFYEHLCNILK